MYKRKVQIRRAAVLLGVFSLILPGMGMRVQAEEEAEYTCTHVHDDACGYVEAAEGSPCTYEHVHDGSCGYVEAAEGSPCTDAHIHDGSCGYSEPSGENSCTYLHVHDENCGYAEAVEGSPCTYEHIHDESCGYVKAMEGSPCTHEHDADCGGAVPASENMLTAQGAEGETGINIEDAIYFTDESQVMGYRRSEWDSQIIDVMADYQGTWIRTTYNRGGYKVDSENLSDADIASAVEFVNGGKYLKLSYTVTAGEDGVQDGRLGIYADTMIGDNDFAALNVIRNSAGQVIGLAMADEHPEYYFCDSRNAQFNIYFSGTNGATGVDTYWFGYLGNMSASVFEQTDRRNYEEALGGGGSGQYTFDEQGETISFGGTDSAIAFSWQNINLEAGQSVTHSVILGVGEKSAPPVWGDGKNADRAPLILTRSGEAGGLTLQVNAAVTDSAGVEDTLYCSMGNDGGVAAGSATAAGNVNIIAGTIDLLQLAGGDGQTLPDGSYDLQFWVVNSRGAASEARIKTVTVADGEITGGLDQPWDGSEWESNTGGSGIFRIENQITGREIQVGGLDAVVAAEENGNAVEVVFTIGERAEETAAGASEIRSAAGDRTLEFLELALTLSVDGGMTEDIGSRNTQLLAVTIPFESDGKHDLAVYRYHGSRVDILTAEPNADGERFELGEGSITIYAEKFSTYALGYYLSEENADNGNASEENADDSVNETKGVKDSEPKVGETAPLPLIPAGIIAGMAYLLERFLFSNKALKRDKNRGQRRLYGETRSASGDGSE